MKSHTADYWKKKLAAFVHDTPTKTLNIPEHSSKSREAMKRAGLDEDYIGKYDQSADHAAAAADRIPFPDSQKSGLRCKFDGALNRFHHPLDGNLQIPLKPIESDQLGNETEQLCQPLLELKDADPQSAEFWQARFFGHWRLWAQFARERDHRFAFLPADTRIPDHTIWNHMQIVSALAGANAEGGPAFLRLQIGGVQDFIAQARNTRDLWSGSYLLSWLMAVGMKKLSEQVGPDAIIFPNLVGQPLFDLHWYELWNRMQSAKDAKPIIDDLMNPQGASTKRWIIPNLPNVFLALVPANRASELAEAVEGAIREEFVSIAKAVWDFAARIFGPEHRARYDAQVQRFLQISWQAQAWEKTLDSACTLAKDAPEGSPLAQAGKRVEAIREMAEVDMPKEHRDWRFYTDKEEKNQLSNVGLAWSIFVAHQQAKHDAVRQTNAFASADATNWDASASNHKDELNGRDEALLSRNEFRQRIDHAEEIWQKLFKKDGLVSALTLIKRTWHLAYLDKEWKGNFQRDDFSFPSTHQIARHKPTGNLEDEDPDELPASEKYFAVLCLDGDEIGKWVSGAKTPTYHEQLAAYTDDSGKHLGAVPYYENLDTLKGFLKEQRALSPTYHLQFSEALSNFALKCTRPIVEAFDGRLIYAGGDDVLAILPADKAIACARALRAAFQGSSSLNDLLAYTEANKIFSIPAEGFLALSAEKDHQGQPIPFVVPGPNAEVSAGIAMAHFKSPLQDVVRAAHVAEKRAKNGLGRAALAVTLMKRSGEITEWGSKWGSNGVELYESILSALKDKQLSSRFPHRICQLLEPHLTQRSELMAGTSTADALDIETAKVLILSEFQHAIKQHAAHEAARKNQTESLVPTLKSYLDKLSAAPPPKEETAMNASGIQRLFSSLINLATAVAFAHRTSTSDDASV